ncbi:MAG: carboxypeptidase-like regulatory domain-containing protein, partial [Bacteroidetes bacterium]|nr:carboxypeptidase-like regulatory domain-containing protein [Fibrella sp.]
SFNLQEVNVGRSKEDPAYSIMRRAIAKARFHQLQVSSYTARYYTKSTATVLDLPLEFLYRDQLKKAEKEINFKKGVPILNETVSEVTFKQPNTIRTRVIATRNSQTDFATPNQFYGVSFYRPEVAGAVSPLSPKAFAYYKFGYEGTFREQGAGGTPVDISKISVTPRSYGTGVFRGTIYIIEDTWAIHSLQLETISQQGFSVQARQVYGPVQGVWMPLNQRYNLDGSYLGVKFTAQFVSSVTFNQFTVNPAFVEDVKVIDEKTETPANVLSNKDIKGQSLSDAVAKQKEFSTQNLKKLIKEYEKQEFKARKERKEDIAVTRNDSIVVDSLANKRGNAFWDSLRTVPLTSAETNSYVRRDSIKIIRKVEIEKDSVKAARDSSQRVNVGQFILGHVWRLDKNRMTTLNFSGLLSNIEYNTVEGYTVESRLLYSHFFDKKRTNQFTLTPVGRYEFGRRQFIGYGTAAYAHKTSRVAISGGRYVYQFNPDNPISPTLNTTTTLLFERNFMKLYQKDYFVNLTATAKPLDGQLSVSGSLEYAQRSQLSNYRDDLKPFFNWQRFSYTPNQPNNAETGTDAANGTDFPTHKTLILNLTASGRLAPTRYRIRNGNRIPLRNNSPELQVNYRRGMADVDYDFVQTTVRHTIETGIYSSLSYQASVGGFLTNKTVYFPDFRHFQGNEFFLQQGDPVASYRLLPFYEYSTRSRFFEGHALVEFRKFALTRLTVLRLLGLKENVFVHYLATPASRNYTEAGYGLDGLIPSIFPFFRVEVIAQFQGGRYQGTGFRIGTTYKFGRR